MAQRIDIQDIEHLKPGEGVRLDDNTKYEFGADLESDKAAILDTGEGKSVVIRVFGFKMNPEVRGEIDKQNIFNAHSKQIATLLWGDGLRPLESVPPRVIIDGKKGTYQIFVPCEARSGVAFADKTRNLSEELLKSSKNGKLDTHET